MTRAWYSAFIAALVLERCAELALSRRNMRWALSRGAIEYGQGHWPFMQALHTAFFAGCLAEVWLLGRPFVPVLGWSCLALALASQGLRYSAIAALGKRWNVRVLVLPGVAAETRGPFRHLRHPNYLAVAIEGIAVPLMHSAWLTAITFSVLNAWLLRVRIRCEERALGEHSSYVEQLGNRRRFWPGRAGQV